MALAEADPAAGARAIVVYVPAVGSPERVHRTGPSLTPDEPDLDELAAWVRTRADERWRFEGVAIEDVHVDHALGVVDVVVPARGDRWIEAVRTGLGDDPRIVVLPGSPVSLR